jgi:4-alpha-glucanotransferase
MTKIHFHIHYHTSGHQIIGVEYHTNNGDEDTPSNILCHTYGDGHWFGNLDVDDASSIYYRFMVVDGEQRFSEAGGFRKISLYNCHQIFLQDQWRNEGNPADVFFSSAFTEVINRPEKSGLFPLEVNNSFSNALIFRLEAADIPDGLVVGITGNTPELGNWTAATLLNADNFPVWEAGFQMVDDIIQLDYKYVLCNPETAEIVTWESGENRTLSFNFPKDKGNCVINTTRGFRYQNYRWRGAGMAIPVFSLRSKRGFGIGEFLDLKDAIDLTQAMSMNVVQILPVNDTIAYKTWKDCYPYAAISVYALNPLYINIDAIGKFKKPKDQQAFEKMRIELNALEHIDLDTVVNHKLDFLKILYEEKKASVFRSKAFKEYFEEQKEWLIPYAAFSYLRDLNGTPDFNKWETHQVYNEKEIAALTQKGSRSYNDIAFYYFIQFFADKQLLEAKAYGRAKKVVLKGDLPIGIYRHSCDAWVSPHLYNMDGQAGAPPDDYAEDGQNWGFPTYNWEVMAKDGFLWWRQRMTSLARYFDALRIDHILGFFRIWEIPLTQISGVMGVFNPRLPLSKEELEGFGIEGDLERYTHPYIREYMLHDLDEGDVEYLKKEFLEEVWEGAYRLSPKVDTQKKVKDRFKLKKYKKYAHLETKLAKMVSEVLLIEEPGAEGQAFNPRITLQKTFSYQALEESERQIWDHIYNYYYYERHNEFWSEQAESKLPAILEATNMLICGEDLGMIPASVPGVMKKYNIIPLEIQRMPKGNTPFGQPYHYDYMSVCSPSCHDMSTIRGWWEADYNRAQQFYSLHMHQEGLPPRACTVDIVRHINQEHLNSPSILAIFPIQDLLGMDEGLRKEDAASEQINDPANSNHYWRFRLHRNIEDILKEEPFINAVKAMVVKSGR